MSDATGRGLDPAAYARVRVSLGTALVVEEMV
jgi:hypothetical protein